MNNYSIESTKSFDKTFEKISKKDQKLARLVVMGIEKLSNNPFQKSLLTHKILTSQWGETFSSRISGDIRILWRFINNKATILALELGGHSGGNSVYK